MQSYQESYQSYGSLPGGYGVLPWQAPLLVMRHEWAKPLLVLGLLGLGGYALYRSRKRSR